MTQLSIVHVLSSFGVGGQECVALDLAKLQLAAGHRVHVLSLSEPPDGPMAARFRAVGALTETVPKRGPSFDPTLALRVAQSISKADADIVHTHNPAALVYGAPAAALARVRSVHTKHGLNPDSNRRMWLRRIASSMVDAYVAVTPTLARVAVERHECDATQLHVISNGVDTGRFMPNPLARRKLRSELGIPETAWVLGTVGRLAPEKNQALLIDAVAPILDPRRHLVIVGDGPDREALMERARGTLRPDLIHFTGARDDVEAVLACFDAFALTSESEGLPLVVLEAMAVGLPVVATAVGGVPDVIEAHKTGFLVPASDRIALMKELLLLSTRPQIAEDVAAAGRSMVLERHSTEQMACDYEHLYRRLLRPGASTVDLPLAANG
jgi:glycosyltransferase involved in cell wall biosynthesis